MIERVLLVIVFLGAAFALYRLCLWRQTCRAAVTAGVDPLLQGGRCGIPTIVYFTTPTCAPCRLQQTPVLNQLQQEMGNDLLRLVRVDATEDPEAATRWGVFSVPTLFVLDQQGQLRQVFNGVVGLDRLRQALQAG